MLMDITQMQSPETANFSDLADKAEQASHMMKLLSNQRRLLLLCHLADAGEMSVGALADSVGLSQSAASQHLALMREDGLIAFRREGQTLHYKIDHPNVAPFLSMLKTVFCNPPASPGTRKTAC